MSSVPTATERSPWPPGFSLAIIAAQARSGSIFSPVASSKSFGIGFEQARREALADQPALAVSAVGIEAVADHRPAVAHRRW